MLWLYFIQITLRNALQLKCTNILEINFEIWENDQTKNKETKIAVHVISSNSWN